jgi:hypothetical protein
VLRVSEPHLFLNEVSLKFVSALCNTLNVPPFLRSPKMVPAY